MIWLQTRTVFWLGGGSISVNCLMYMGLVMLGRHTYIHTAKSPVPEPRAFEVEMAIEKLKGHKSQGNGQIPTELIKTG